MAGVLGGCPTIELPTATPTPLGTPAPAPLVLTPPPAAVPFGTTVTLSGTAAPGSTVSVYFHASGEAGYTLRHTVMADPHGIFASSYLATRDERYYLLATDSTGSPSSLTQVAPTITTPAVVNAGRNAAVAVRGTAGIGASVVLHFHKQGTAATDYSITRTIATSGAGTWAKSFTLTTGYRVYATVGLLRSSTVLFATTTPVRTAPPTITNPASTTAPRNTSVTVHGTAVAGVPVTVHFHKQGTAATDYSIARTVSASAAGTWAKTFSLDTGYRVYATVGSSAHSNTVLFAPAPAATGCTVSLSNPTPTARAKETLSVSGPANAVLYYVVHYATTDHRYSTPGTDASGHNTSVFYVGNPRPAYRVLIDVYAGATHCSTSFVTK